ncbi:MULTISPECIES: hypothetical protein [Bacillus]|uniref:hypothetical protein n=1 Tax=Bacillus TaxID=1386 RepID=UPI000B0C80AD|nr:MULTISPECIES: hypothetical protein [Bacillus]MDZ7434339.1 hypothetical protein [Bacillus amyloliquefaciens]MEC1019367.1 hypothetical protein [Bacillus velezensis]MED4627186.1 hypothetical protein [Bacillus velezensis]UHD41606.1 hypothetical protein LUX28_20705 [Bacillus velezensis]UTQ08513.1 hypothetical protein NMK97_20840 [Bacillus amyloliquefaciens]
MAILTARFIKDGIEKEYEKSDITPDLYNETLKGYLYCPTKNCGARVIYNSGVKSFLRTWNMDNHIDDCIHGFTRAKKRVGVDTTQFINVELTAERKKRALKEAYKLYTMSDDEKTIEKTKKPTRKNNPTTVGKESVPVTHAVLQDGDQPEEVTNRRIGIRGPNLPKRTVDMLKDIDNGKPRLVMGKVKSVKLIESIADIIVEEGKTNIHVKFEEVFINNSPAYLGLFHHILKYQKENKNQDIVFTGIGEVRRSKVNGDLELSVFYGTDFSIDGMDLIKLSMRKS